LSICPHAVSAEANSLKARRANEDDPPASGYIVVASVYVAAVHTKMRPAIRKTTGVIPSAKIATRPRA
jgi:hypothetical protein